MKTRQLGRTGLKVSRICFGTWQFGGDWGEFDDQVAHAAIRRGFERGINFFDTAQAYGFGRSEALLGEALRSELRNKRDSVVLSTKGGLRKEGGGGGVAAQLVRDSSPEFLRTDVEQSLRSLGVDTIDLYHVHWPDPRTPFAKTADALACMVEEGKIRYVAVSNFDAAQMREFEKTRRIDAIQPPYHMLRRDIEEEILPYCLERGIGVLAYGPLAHGLLAGKYTAGTMFADSDWRSLSGAFKGERFARNLQMTERLARIAERLKITAGQLAIAWVLANPAVDVAVVGMRSPEQVDGTVPAAEVLLSVELLQEISDTLRQAVPTGGPSPEGDQ